MTRRQTASEVAVGSGTAGPFGLLCGGKSPFFRPISGREPTRTAALLGRVYVRQRGRSTSFPAVAQNAGQVAGTNAGGRGAGTSAARFRMLPLTRLPRIWWGSNAACLLRGPDGISIGRQVIHSHTSPQWPLVQHQDLNRQ